MRNLSTVLALVVAMTATSTFAARPFTNSIFSGPRLLAPTLAHQQLQPIPDPHHVYLPAPAPTYGSETAGVPAYGAPPVGLPVYGDSGPMTAQPQFAAPAIPLFHRVKYKDLDEKHPFAVTKIVRVRNPCQTCGDGGCVYIAICVPPCECEEIKVRRNGTRIEYDYGKYEVDVRVKDGYIEVDYQD